MLAKSLNLIQTLDTWNASMFEGDDPRKMTQHRKLKIHSERVPIWSSCLSRIFIKALIGTSKILKKENREKHK